MITNQKSKHQLRVEEFMKLAGQEVPVSAKTPPLEIRLLRAKLILEEAFETISEGLGVECEYNPERMAWEFLCVRPFDMVELVDGCCDLKVVTTGTLSACGISDLPMQLEVDHNNLAKFGPGSYRRDDGKWIKPPNHQPPRIAELLKEQE